MRAFVIHDENGKIVSATIVPTNIQGDVTPVASQGHRLTGIDATQLVSVQRPSSKSDTEAITKALSNLMIGTSIK